MNDQNPQQPDAADLASLQRAVALHQKYPEKSREELAEVLIQTTCIEVARKSAATAGLAVLPSFNMILSLAVGSLANNLSAPHRSQADLVLDIATIYGYRFRPNEKPFYLAVVMGLPTGNPQRNANNQGAADQLLAKGGQQLANQATQRLARSTVGRALPIVNVARAAGSNVLMTYAAAQRAKRYIKAGPASLGNMESDIQALLQSDELKLSEWTRESLSQSMANLSDTMMENFDQGAQDVGRAAGRAVRNFRNFWREATKPKS